MIPFPKQYIDALRVSVFDNFFSNNQLSYFYNQLESIPYDIGQTFSNSEETPLLNDNSIRTSKVKWIPIKEEWGWLYSKFMDMVTLVNNEVYNFDLVSIPAEIQYTEYHATNKGHYSWHTDIGHGPASFRKISITIQLSDSNEYEGGDLEFNLDGNPQQFPRIQNTAAIFPSYLLHRVTPVTKGVRKSLVLWVGGAPFR